MTAQPEVKVMEVIAAAATHCSVIKSEDARRAFEKPVRLDS